MSAAVRIFLAIAAVAVMGYLGWRFLYAPSEPTTIAPPANPSALVSTPSSNTPLTPISAAKTGPRERPTQVAALGRLEPVGGIIDIGGTTGDRVGQLMVKEGEQVAAGQELARLESYTLREAELKVAQLSLADAQRRQPVEKNYSQAVIQAAQAGAAQADLMSKDRASLLAKLDVTKASLEVAEADLKRLMAIRGRIVSQQDIEHQQLRVRQAEAELKVTQADIEKLDASLSAARAQADAKLAEANAGAERVQAALQLEVLQQNVHLAEERIKLSSIRAPRAGQVLKIITRPGETIAQRPVMRLGDTSQMVAVVEVYETQIWSITLGQEATLTSRALDKPLHGKVAQVGRMVATNEVLSLDPTKAADNRVIEVRIEVDEDAEAAKLINLQIDAVIDTRGER